MCIYYWLPFSHFTSPSDTDSAKAGVTTVLKLLSTYRVKRWGGGGGGGGEELQ